MQKLLLGIAAVTALIATPVLAADMPLKAPPMAPAEAYSWTGFYVGVNAGGYWAHVNDPAFVSFNVPGPGFTPNAVAALDQMAPNNLKPSGFAGGGQLGYNWQIGNFVLGAEADIDGMTGSANRDQFFSLLGIDTAHFVDSAKLQSMGTVRGRFGFTESPYLVYVTGGLAVSS